VLQETRFVRGHETCIIISSIETHQICYRVDYVLHTVEGKLPAILEPVLRDTCELTSSVMHTCLFVTIRSRPLSLARSRLQIESTTLLPLPTWKFASAKAFGCSGALRRETCASQGAPGCVGPPCFRGVGPRCSRWIPWLKYWIQSTAFPCLCGVVWVGFHFFSSNLGAEICENNIWIPAARGLTMKCPRIVKNIVLSFVFPKPWSSCGPALCILL